MKRINIALDSKAHMRAKVIAALRGQSLNEYLAEALRKSVKEALRK